MNEQHNTPAQKPKKVSTAALSGLATIIVILGSAIIILLAVSNCSNKGLRSFECAAAPVAGTIFGAPVILILLIIGINIVVKYKYKNKK